MTQITRAWHFLYEGGFLRDGNKAPDDGEWLIHNGPVIPRKSGLHASLHPFDTLQYAAGSVLCLVEFEGDVIQERDKIVGYKRRIVARMDATEMLQYYARMQALSVLHLWDAPNIVIDYILTGNTEIRDAARAAASDAAWYAARDAARGAARGAAWTAAWDAARTEFQTLVHECFSDYM